MAKFAILALAILSVATLACQDYSTGLQSSVTKVDETVATGTLRTLSAAQQTYSVTNGGNYATFQQLYDAGFLDLRFKNDPAAKSLRLKDYVFTMEVGSDSDGPYFRCNADPVPPKEGRHFYIDSTNAMRSNPTAPASITDPVVRP